MALISSCQSACPQPVEMCPQHRGDTISFSFTFKDKNNEPLDISGMVLFFTMKQVAASADGLSGDLQDSVTFPSDADSVLGLGTMDVLPTKTNSLIPGTDYNYDFQLVNGADWIKTVGWGTLPIEQDITLAVS